MEQVVMLNSILSGYVVRATRVDDDNAEVVGTVSVVDRVHRYVKFEHIIHGFKFDEWDFEIIERPVQLPTGENAMVAHPTDDTWVPYVRSRGSWWVPGGQNQSADEETIKEFIRDHGFDVIYEGIEQ